MKLVRALKKYCLFALAICVFSTLFIMNSSSIQAVKASEKPVELYYSYSSAYYINEYLDVYVKTSASGSNEDVAIHARSSGTRGEWVDYSGTYIKTLEDGSKIWKVEVSYAGDNIEYAIKYQVDGNTYWDNNNGNNYTKNNVLGAANIGVIPSESYDYKNPSDYAIRVNVKNLAYDKKVNVRYTEDNWENNSYKDVPLKYISTNADGSELWGTNLNLNQNTLNKFHYAVSYEVNGTVYWDNNFDANYNY